MFSGSTWKAVRRTTVVSLLATACVLLGCWIWVCVEFLSSGLDSIVEALPVLWNVLVILFLMGCCIRGIVTRVRYRSALPERPRSKVWIWTRILVAIVVLRTMVANTPFIALAISLQWMRLKAEHFSRSRMEHIVSEVRAEKFTGKGEFFADDTGDLTNPPHPTILNSNVWADRANDGTLTVSIITGPYGHAGTYGFVYFDKPQTPQKADKELGEGVMEFEIDGPMLETRANDQIDQHWWRIFNDED